MPAKITSVDNYNNINKIDFGEKVIFFKFTGEWCKPCKALEKNLECISDIIVYNIDIDNEDFESFLEKSNITTIPYTIMKYKNKTMHFKGLRETHEIVDMINILKQAR